MKQLKVFDKILNKYCCDSTVYGVMLIGSVADGSATSTSLIGFLQFY